jgi:EAL domain-containing protein (putative c-di-GMP-specific phosphodiesterase class I)/PAS domain-containing protein
VPTDAEWGATPDPHVRLPQARLPLLALVPVAVVVLAVLPFSTVRLGTLSSFMPAMLAIVGLLDVISAVLLVGQFRDSGDRRSLLLGSAYVFSLTVGIGFAAAFPGVMADGSVIGGWPSTAPWLWTTWHAGFPLLLAASVAPWPRRWSAPVPPEDRGRKTCITIGGVALAGAAAVLGACLGEHWLPTLIQGADTSALTHVVGPLLLPLIAIATGAAVVGATRLTGPVRWAALATAAILGDDVLSLAALSRYSLGWYVGRGLTVLASAVVLVAMLTELSGLKRRLAVEAGRLRLLLTRSEELESLHGTLLDLMSDGVLLRGHDQRVMAINPAAEELLGLNLEQLQGGAPLPAGWAMVRTDGAPLLLEDAPGAVTVRTGLAQRDQVVGIPVAGGGRRWLRVSTRATRDPVDDSVQYVVSSLTDVTESHEASVAAREQLAATRRRVQAVLDEGGPQIFVQPIKDLRTGATVGGEALSRFQGPIVQGPDRWFGDAAAVGLGVELELSAVRRALALLARLPGSGYLSINVSPAAAVHPALFDLLSRPGVPCRRVVLEVTEHTDVADYGSLLDALAPLRALGFRIAVDDAGAGFASMSHILHLRPDIVKLDMSLVRGIHQDPARRALAEGMLLFVREIGGCLIAEGIETAEDMAALVSVGLTHGQGYFLGRPAPYDSAPSPSAAGHGADHEERLVAVEHGRR